MHEAEAVAPGPLVVAFFSQSPGLADADADADDMVGAGFGEALGGGA